MDTFFGCHKSDCQICFSAPKVTIIELELKMSHLYSFTDIDDINLWLCDKFQHPRAKIGVNMMILFNYSQNCPLMILSSQTWQFNKNTFDFCSVKKRYQKSMVFVSVSLP